MRPPDTRVAPGMFAAVAATAAVPVVAALPLALLLPVPGRRILLLPASSRQSDNALALPTAHSHVVLRPLLWLLPLRRLVPLVVVILFAAAFADHLLPVAEAPLLLQRPPHRISIAIALVVQSFLLVLVLRARPVAGFHLFAVVVLVLDIAVAASFLCKNSAVKSGRRLVLVVVT
jgi:hypothetical protein